MKKKDAIIPQEPKKDQPLKPNINALVEKDKQERMQIFSGRLDVLLKEFNISLAPRITISGNNVISEIIITAN